MLSKIFARVALALIVIGAAVWGGFYLLRPVAVAQAAWRDTAPNAVSATVSVRAERSARLVSEVSGRIKQSHLELGRTVAAGEVLVEIDSSLLQIDIRQTEADIASLRRVLEIGSSSLFNLQTQKDDLVIKQRLFERGSVSKMEIERHERGIAQLQQTIDLDRQQTEDRIVALENSLDAKKINLARMTIRSPIDGVISEVFAFQDDLINSGTAIAQIISVSRVVEAKISEESFANVAVGQQATARFTGYGGTIFNARVAKVLPAADPETQRYTIHLAVEIAPEKLVSGLTGEALITVAEHPDAIIIPRHALVGNRVYVLDGTRVSVREVSPGFTSLTVVEIADGLQEGELVITEELDRFRDGQRVRVQERTRE